MSEKSVSPVATERSVPTIKTDLSTTKLVDIKGETQNQCKTSALIQYSSNHLMRSSFLVTKAEKVNNSPHLYLNDATSQHMYLNVDTTSLSSVSIYPCFYALTSFAFNMHRHNSMLRQYTHCPCFNKAHPILL